MASYEQDLGAMTKYEAPPCEIFENPIKIYYLNTKIVIARLTKVSPK